MELLCYFESIRTPFLTLFFKFWTLFGEETLVFAVICLIYWCINKKFAYKIAFTMFVSGVIVQNLKISFRIERPWIRDPNFTPVDGSVTTATGYSFPSGHTQGASSFFGTLAIQLRKVRYTLLCTFVILMVALSRMYLGVHTPQDVIVSMVLTVVTASICSYVFDRWLDNDKHDLTVSIIFALISLATIILSSILMNIGYIEAIHASDCFKLAGTGFGVAVGWYIERKFIKFDTKEKNIVWQTIKLVIGLLIAVALKSGLKIILGDGLIMNVIRYFITVIWILAIYPLIFTNIRKRS
jgi:Membrane-associated phospholipid phosphatase